MNNWVMVGVLLIIVGFALRMDVLAVVLIAGIVTGLIAQINIVEVLSIIGKGFVDNRYMSLFLIAFPVIVILERYGMREKAGDAIRKLSFATTGGLLSVWLVIRTIAAALSLRIGGHVQFIRPLILPMAQGAAEKNGGKLTEKGMEDLKGLAAATENYGNFFGQNIFPTGGGVLLILGTLKEAGFVVDQTDIAFSSIWAGVAICIVGIVQCVLFDLKLRKEIVKDA